MDLGVLALLLLSTIAFSVVGQGNVWAAVAPVLLAVLVHAICKAPLRYTLFAATFCALTLETPYMPLAWGEFKSPLAPLGGLLLANLNQVTGVQALHFTGLDCLAALLLLVACWRRATGSTIDGKSPVPAAGIVNQVAATFLFFLLAVWGYGILRGGSFSDSLWQMHKLLYLPVLFFLFQSALRGPQDYGMLAKIFVAAAVLRSAAAILIRAYVPPPGPDPLPVATTHSDSLLFACALSVIIAVFFERPVRFRFLLHGGVAALLVWGMIANTRRIVWVHVSGVLIAYALLTAWTPLKRRMARTALVLLPFALVYVAAGWHSRSPAFAPVTTIRSVIDPESDSSTEWREGENFNLIYTILDRPLLGSGFGHEYTERWVLPSISGTFRQYRFNPHNSVLGLWTAGGLIGFSGIWMVLVVAVFLSVRSYRRSPEPGQRACALVTLAAVISYISQAFGDIGLQDWTGAFTMGPALAVVAKLATVTGAWPKKGGGPAPPAPPESSRGVVPFPGMARPIP